MKVLQRNNTTRKESRKEFKDCKKESCNCKRLQLLQKILKRNLRNANRNYTTTKDPNYSKGKEKHIVEDPKSYKRIKILQRNPIASMKRTDQRNTKELQISPCLTLLLFDGIQTVRPK